MLVLIIEKPGLTIRIPGIKETRSPANIDITKVSINNVLAALKKDGISDFKIVEGKEYKKGREKKTKEITKEQETIIVQTSLDNFKQSNLESKLDKIEKLVLDLISSPNKETIIYKDRDVVESKGKIEKVEEEFDDPEFIPEINIDRMLSKKAKLGTINRDDDLDSIVNSLRNIKK